MQESEERSGQAGEVVRFLKVIGVVRMGVFPALELGALRYRPQVVFPDKQQVSSHM